MKAIIKSILDSDLYKFTMMNWVIQHYPEAEGVSRFNNRDLSMKFNTVSLKEIQKQVMLMGKLKLTDQEYDWMKNELPFLPVSYRQYLAAYRFNPDQVAIKLDDENNLDITITGKWRDKILWEVPLMAIISEVYFKYMDTDWSMVGQVENARDKAKRLSDNGCSFTDFGTRRRRSFEVQELVVREMKNFSGFMGTSNPYLAMKYNVKALGTCAHEAIGAVAALESLNRPNKIFMERWTETYKGSLGTVLPDTFGTKSFIKDFSLEKAKLWDGPRHDSGDPFNFVDIFVTHYKSLGIDPMTKTVIFSDGLDIETTIKLHSYCKDKIKCSFGIGTFLTNDFKKISTGEKSKALNMVIKLVEINGVPVVKLSDNPIKAIGDPKMIEIMKYLHFGDRG